MKREGVKELLLDYDRFMTQASWLRIKEWDYYYIMEHKKQHCLTCTMSDLGFAKKIPT